VDVSLKKTLSQTGANPSSNESPSQRPDKEGKQSCKRRRGRTLPPLCREGRIVSSLPFAAIANQEGKAMNLAAQVQSSTVYGHSAHYKYKANPKTETRIAPPTPHRPAPVESTQMASHHPWDGGHRQLHPAKDSWEPRKMQAGTRHVPETRNPK
jgi:hypothetical protein